MLIHNVGAFVVLAFAGMMMGISGILLCPAVMLHEVLTIWCVANLQDSGANA